MDIFSFDIHTNFESFSSCMGSIKEFLNRDGVLVWSLVPTGYELSAKEGLGFPITKQKGIW